MQTPVELKPHFMAAESEYAAVDAGYSTDKRFWYSREWQPYHNPIEGVVSAYRYHSSRHPGAFNSRGGRLYKDIGDILEACTPETSNPDDLVTYELAEEEMVVRSLASHIDRYSDKHEGDEPRTIRIHRRLTNHGETLDSALINKSVGFHENYYMYYPKGSSRKEHAAKLVPFLMGRTVFTGAGQASVDPDTGEAVIVPAQKARHVGATVGSQSSTTGRKAWIMVRATSEDHDGKPNGRENQYMRIQVAGGDANISPWATHFAFASTDIAITLLDNGIDLGYQVRDGETYVDFSAVNQAIADDYRGEAKVKVILDGKTVERTPMELLDNVMNLAKDNIHLLSPRQVEFLQNDWIVASDDYHEDPMLLHDRADWICKQWLADAQREKYLEKHPEADPEEDPKKKLERLKSLDLLYDAFTGVKDKSGEIGPGLGWKLRKRGHFRYDVDWDAVEQAIYHGPADTRGLVRGEALRMLHAIPGTIVSSKKVDWSLLVYSRVDGPAQLTNTIRLSDPGGKVSRKVQAQLDLLTQLAIENGAEDISMCPDPSCDVCNGYRKRMEQSATV
jgi:hypothetical protein